MKNNILLSVLGTMILLVLSIGIFHYYHPTHYQFNDRFILGKTEEDIVERYGEFTKSRRNELGEIVYGTYMIRGNTPEWIMSYDNSLWYEVYFENEIAKEIRLQEGWYGG